MSCLQATQTDDSLKTADAVVLVTVEDVNDSPPVFDQNSYSVTLLENSPNNNTVFKAIVTDTDEVLSILNHSIKINWRVEAMSYIICYIICPREDLWGH